MTNQLDDQKYILYSFLDIPRDASQEEIKKQYRIMAMKFHPDKNSSEESKEIFQKINQAYSILSDPVKKELYD